MKKYNISKEYGLFAKIHYPFNKMIFALSHPILNICKHLVHSDKNIKVTKRKITTYDNKKIDIIIYEPKQSKTNKVMLYLHGGAFIFKGNPKHFSLCKTYVKKANIKVVFVDYRTSPKYKFPIPVEDCFSAYKWIIKNSNQLNVDKEKIIIAGDSAGGCLTVDVTKKAIDEQIQIPYFNMLIYPALDKTMSTESMKKYTNTPIWNAKLNKKMWPLYLGNKQYISPVEISDLSKFPKTYIETAEFDCLHDEAIIFYEKLKKSNIEVILNETKQTFHGFEIKKCSITEQAIAKRIEIINALDNKINFN